MKLQQTACLALFLSVVSFGCAITKQKSLTKAVFPNPDCTKVSSNTAIGTFNADLPRALPLNASETVEFFKISQLPQACRTTTLTNLQAAKVLRDKIGGGAIGNTYVEAANFAKIGSDEYIVYVVTFPVASGENTNGIWIFKNNKFFEIQTDGSIKTWLAKEVPGLVQTYMEVIDTTDKRKPF